MPRNPKLSSSKPPLTKMSKINKIAIAVVAVLALALSYSFGYRNGQNDEKNTISQNATATLNATQTKACSNIFGTNSHIGTVFGTTISSLNFTLSSDSSSELVCDFTTANQNSLVLVVVNTSPKSLIGQHGLKSENVVTYRAKTGQVWTVAATSDTKNPVTRKSDAYLFSVAMKL